MEAFQPPRVKTDDFFLRDFNRATTPARHLPILISCFIYFLFPVLSSFHHLYHVFPIHSGCIALTSNADGNAILLTCVLSAPLLLYPSLSLWASGTVSLRSTKHILFPLLLPKLHLASWAWLRPGFVQNHCCALEQLLLLSHPRQVRKGGGTGLLIFYKLEILNLYSPMQ